MNGLIVIDKPGGMTSQDVVYRVKKWFPRGTKVGHTGTLDPLATGVLVVCVGTATRLADIVQAMGKSYASRFRFGATSDTDDADGTVIPTPIQDPTPPSEADVRAALARFVGDIEQLPPAYSALKIGGRRSHALARSGTAVSHAPRPVRVDAVRLVGYAWPFADVEIDCGKGTYIRSIARDTGEILGVGGLVETLRRTRIGPFTPDAAATITESPDVGRSKLLPPATAAIGIPRVTILAESATRFRCGIAVAPTEPTTCIGDVGVYDAAGDIVGIAEMIPGGLARPYIVLDRWKC
ncbi:MAG: tRNA pseudouridine(55) synthase TruB, partial [Fimbriiglobus sp.]